jgi:hypothetical protein
MRNQQKKNEKKNSYQDLAEVLWRARDGGHDRPSAMSCHQPAVFHLSKSPDNNKK